MAVCAIYEMKDIQLPLAVDLFEKTIVPSIAEESVPAYEAMCESIEYSFMASNTEDKCLFDDWSQVKNKLYFIEGYVALFREPIEGMWVAYEALNLIFTMTPSGKTGYMQQVFFFKKQKFWVCLEDKQVIFLTPEEY